MTSQETIDELKNIALMEQLSNNFTAPSINLEEGIGRWEIEFREELNETYNDWVGNKKEGNQWIKDEKKEPLMNEKGARILISSLKNTINKITSLSTFKENEINLRAEHFSKETASELAKSHKEWGINLLHHGDIITQEIEVLFKAGLAKSVEGLTVKSRVKRVIETFTHNDQPKNKGGILPKV